jgi:hypothetical protein
MEGNVLITTVNGSSCTKKMPGLHIISIQSVIEADCFILFASDTGVVRISEHLIVSKPGSGAVGLNINSGITAG